MALHHRDQAAKLTRKPRLTTKSQRHHAAGRRGRVSAASYEIHNVHVRMSHKGSRVLSLEDINLDPLVMVADNYTSFTEQLQQQQDQMMHAPASNTSEGASKSSRRKERRKFNKLQKKKAQTEREAAEREPKETALAVQMAETVLVEEENKAAMNSVHKESYYQYYQS